MTRTALPITSARALLAARGFKHGCESLNREASNTWRRFSPIVFVLQKLSAQPEKGGGHTRHRTWLLVLPFGNRQDRGDYLYVFQLRFLDTHQLTSMLSAKAWHLDLAEGSGLIKAYAVDYWSGPNVNDDPDRTDYGNEREVLERLAPTRENDDGFHFYLWILYERNGAGRVPETRNWDEKLRGGAGA